MRAPAGPWVELEEVDSTQRVAAEHVREGRNTGVVFARHQSAGKGRMGRVWHSDEGDSLTFSLVFSEYAGHPKPYLIGMAMALAAAGAVHTQVRWPNDLVLGTKKVGGILTELIPRPDGLSVPVVGIGINLNQQSFPEDIELIATSLAQQHGQRLEPVEVARQVFNRIALMPEPREWGDLSPVWELFDRTPGKMYRLPGGEMAEAIGVGSDGQLLCAVEGESRMVMAAEAIFGNER